MQKEIRQYHALSKHPSYRAWQSMHSRVNNSKDASYKRYGKRGISICGSWYKLENFISDMGIKPTKKHSLGRINNNGNYEPINCRWEIQIQQENNKSTNRNITYMGLTYTIAEWERLLKFKPNVLRYKLIKNDDIERAIFYTEEKDMSLVFNNVKQSIQKWAKEVQLPLRTLTQRIFKLKWNTAKALSTPYLHNKIRSIRYLTVNGTKDTIKNWSEKYKLSREVISYRIDKLNMSDTEAVTTPIIRKRKYSK